MRVVIDLQACQRGTEADVSNDLAFAKAVVRTAGSHDVCIALCDQFGYRVELIRQAFVGLVSADRIAVYQLPFAEASFAVGWRRSAAELIRESFLENLSPNFVFVPNAMDGHIVLGAYSGIGSYQSVLSFRPLTVSDTGRTGSEIVDEAFGRHEALCQSAAFIVEISNPSLLPDLESKASDFWRSCETLALRQVPSIAPVRKRLAYVSPLPPVKSGIADYSAQLVPQLAKFYDIALIVDQEGVSLPRMDANLPVHTLEWFEQHSGEFERILYHVGNSPAHRHLFGLMQRHPGIVVLHDFYLGNVIDFLDHSDVRSNEFLRSLYLSHGWSGVLDREASGHVDSVWKFPCNKDVLDSANGVIVHSLHSKALAESWYGSKYSERWASIPLIRELSGTRDRERARQTLGLPVGAFITCSFGLLGPTKMNDQLLKAWLDSPLGLNESCYLIFVGENDKGTYGRELEDSISKCPAKHRIRITGFVTHEHYRNFLCACDSAVQLRRQSRGETSAAILDCLLYGVPTISNAHGAGVELPDSVVVMLEDAFSNRSLSAALTQLWEDAELRHRLSGLAQEHVQSKHNPTLVGELYHQSIEQMVIQSSSLRYRRLLNALGRIDSRDKNSDDDIIACAKAIAANTPVSGQRQLLVDVSAMVQTDLRTGIQRVVRSILSAFLLEPPSNFRVEPVFTMGAGEPYRYARSYMQRAFSLPTVGFLDDPIEVRFGDRFLGLDLFLEGTHRNESVLQDFRNRGVEIFFVVFDILPLLQPSWFPKGVDADFKCWLNAVSNVSDGLLCISRSVSDDLCKWLSQHSPKGIEPLGLGHFRLGADIRASAPSKGLLDDADNLFVRMSLRPSVLMVGTLEPRKGHAQALSAFELLWNSGVDVNLVIVGKHGWLVDSLVERIELHRERGSRLFWIHGASDETLLKIYAGSSGLLAASEGEGFGLPLVEAALHNLPILARDLPVFREVAGDHAYYFVGLTAQSLAESLTVWLSLLNESCAPVWNDFTWLTWAQSAREMLDLMETRDWDHVVPKHLPKLDLYGTT